MLASQATSELAQYVDLKLGALGLPAARNASDRDLSGNRRRHFFATAIRKINCWASACARSILEFRTSWTTICARSVPTARRACRRTHLFWIVPAWRESCRCRRTGNTFSSPYLNSYRVPQGVLHNPHSDRRTTQGVFHIAEGGFPIPADKQAVPTADVCRAAGRCAPTACRRSDAAVHRRPA